MAAEANSSHVHPGAGAGTLNSLKSLRLYHIDMTLYPIGTK